MNITHLQKGSFCFLLKILLIVVSFMTSILLMLVFTENDTFQFLFLLPLFHSITLVFSFYLFVNIEKHIARMILLGGYTIRNVITPLFLFFGKYEISTISIYDSDKVLYAVLVMSFETIIVFLTINIKSSKHNIIDRNIENKQDMKMYYYHGTFFNFITMIITIAMMICLIIVPSISDAYQNLWKADDNVIVTTFSTISQYGAGTVQRILYAFFLMFFSIMQIIWSLQLINLIKRNIGSNTLGVVLCFVVLGINTLFISETSAYTLFVLLILVVYLMRIFNNKRQTIISFGAIGVLIILLMMVIVRANTYNDESRNYVPKLATFLNAYFPGVINVSIMPNVKVPSKYISLYYDIYNSIPLQSIIKPLVLGERLSNYFNYAIGTSYQILPFVGQTFYYFGIFGPLVQSVIVCFALEWEQKSIMSADCIHFVAYLTSAVLYSAGCIMYDLTIILAFTFKTIIPFLILAYLVNKPCRKTLLIERII